MIEPYYASDDGRVTLYCGDCLEVMPKVRASLIFADPPFNVGKRYGETGDNRSDYRNWTARWICEAFDSLNEGGSFYHMTITRHFPMVFQIMDAHG